MSVEQRLKRLERQNQWMRRLGAVGVALAAAVFLMGQWKEPPDLVVRSLTLMDATGRTRAELGVRGGVSALTLKDEAGRPRIRLVAGKTVSQVILRGAKDPKPRILLASSFAGGGPYISLYDKAYTSRWSFSHTIGSRTPSAASGRPRVWIRMILAGRTSRDWRSSKATRIHGRPSAS